MPRELHDKIADGIFKLLVDDREPEEIDPEHLPGVLVVLARSERGEFATDEEVAAAFRSFEVKKRDG